MSAREKSRASRKKSRKEKSRARKKGRTRKKNVKPKKKSRAKGEKVFAIKKKGYIPNMNHELEVINGPQALSRVLLCTQRAAFYDNNN